MKRLILLTLVAGSFYAADAQTVTTTRVKTVNNIPVLTTREVRPTNPRTTKVILPTNEVIIGDDRVETDRGNLPPGHAKKVYGSKSARAYAPGHQKKRNEVWNDRDDDHKGSKGKHKHGKRNKKNKD